MFYTSLLNNTLLLQQPFIFLISKMSYDITYYNKSPQSKIVTAIMCFLGATKLVELLTYNCPQIDVKKLLQNINSNDSNDNESNDTITDEDVKQITAFNERSDVSGVTNDVDRLNEQITELCEK